MNTLEEIINILRQTFPNTEFQCEITLKDIFITFDNQLQQDYFFGIEITNNFTIVDFGAILKNQPKNSYFWHLDIENIEDYSLKEVPIEVIIETLEILINHKTRITQKRNLLSNSFTLDYFDNGKWVFLSRNNGLKRLSFPKIEGISKTYE